MGDTPEPSSPSPPAEGSMTASSASTSTNADNFDVLSKLPCSMSSSSKSQFNQVIFHDLNEIYPCDSDFRCTYSLTEDINPQPGDKVSLFKVGWKSVSEYITFIRPNVNLSDGRLKYVIIPAADLPKNPGDNLYQLCYISCGNVVAGASVPFSFHKPHESELVAVEDPLDPGLVVFRSRAGQLQDQLHLKTQKCEELLLERVVKNEQLDILRKELHDLEIRNASLEKELKELREKSDVQLTNEKTLEEHLKRCSEQEETIKNLQEIIAQQQEVISNKERDVEKAQEECGELRELLKQLKVASDTIETLRKEVNEVTQYSQNLKAEVQLKKLAVETLLKDNERLEKQNAEGEIKLKKAVLMHNNVVSEKLEIERELAMAENVIRDFSKRMEERTAFIQAIQNTGPRNERQAEMIDLEDRLMVANIQLQDLKEVHNECSVKILELSDELQRTKDEHEIEVAQLVKDKVECQERIQKIILELKSKKSSVTDPLTDLFDSFVSLLGTRDRSKPSTSPQADAPKPEKDDTLESRLRKMTQMKKEVQEELVQVRHSRDEINVCLKSTNEENASLKSRITVLELELAALKTNAGVYKTGGTQNIVSALEAFNKNIDVVDQFNKSVDECKMWKSKCDERTLEIQSLQAKVEDLLMKDALMCIELDQLKSNTNDQFTEQQHDDLVMSVAQNISKDLKDMKDKYRAERKEREALEKQLVEARKHLVGKVSVESCKKIQDDNARLQALLDAEKLTSGCLKGFVFAIFENDTAPIYCPMCPTEFPRKESESFINHFMSHVN